MTSEREIPTKATYESSVKLNENEISRFTDPYTLSLSFYYRR